MPSGTLNLANDLLAIVDRAGGNANMAYWFVLGMGIIGWTIICFVDVDKAKIDVARFLEREAEENYTEEQRLAATEINLKGELFERSPLPPTDENRSKSMSASTIGSLVLPERSVEFLELSCSY